MQGRRAQTKQVSGVSRRFPPRPAIILGTGWYWLDPATALAIAVIVGYHARKLTRRIIAALRSPPPAPSSVR